MRDVKTKNQMRSEILNIAGKGSGKEVLAALPWEKMNSRIGEALEALLHGQEQLRNAYQSHLAASAKRQSAHDMTFALDGRLVGDIGELIAAEIFALDLLGTKAKNIDAITTEPPKRKVQIKATFQENSLSIKHGADYIVGLQLSDTGQYRVIYNGPASTVMAYLRAPKATGHAGRMNAGSRLEPISLGAWATLDLAVNDAHRIPRRKARCGRG